MIGRGSIRHQPTWANETCLFELASFNGLALGGLVLGDFSALCAFGDQFYLVQIYLVQIYLVQRGIGEFCS